MCERPTTAETLVLEVRVAHRLMGAERSTRDSGMWGKPHLDALENQGLTTWTFDENGNFCVRPPELISAPEAITIAERRRTRVRSASGEVSC
jgi:hypothetical protein